MITGNVIPHRFSPLITLLLYGKKVCLSLGRKREAVKNNFILMQLNSKEFQAPSSLQWKPSISYSFLISLRNAFIQMTSLFGHHMAF